MGLGIDAFDAQYAHQPLDSLAVRFQFDGHLPASVERDLEVQLVELPEQVQVLRTLRPRLVVIGRARPTEQFALPLDTQSPMLRIDP
jgi:hypothetical protein